jgi:hypothetical protein
MKMRYEALHQIFHPFVFALRIDENGILRNVLRIEILQRRDFDFRGIHAQLKECQQRSVRVLTAGRRDLAPVPLVGEVAAFAVNVFEVSERFLKSQNKLNVLETVGKAD